MSTQSPETADSTAMRSGSDPDRRPRLKRVLSAVRRRGRNGTPATVAGGALLAAAVRTARRSRRRAGVIALAGAALLGVGLRRRRSESGPAASGGSERGHSAEASAHQSASDLQAPTERNPRGVDSSDVATDPNEGSVQFTTRQDETGEPKPHLDPDDPIDPRYADQDDPETAADHVEVSLSSTKTTDELGKVAAPDEEQAYPAMEGTDPEPMSEKAPQRYGEGTVANERTDHEDVQTGDENQATEGESDDDEEST